ncbi:MAG: D-glycerate dehydrogenase [Alphaproteobacteria bacterium]|nr:D-glycerate dehydrogenase [Alphaproteobacteria bacterium]
MPHRRPRVIVTRKLPDLIETRMMELFDCKLNLDDRPFSRADLAGAMAEAEVLVPTVTDEITADLVRAAGPQLKLIASFGTGVNHIALDAAKDKGITVTNTPGVLTEDTADMTMALILAVARRLGEGERLLRAGKWQGWAPTAMLGMRLTGKRLGIVGMGRIGTAVAMRARAFGLSIHYHNRRRLDPALEAEVEATYWESLDQMLGHMDVVSLNCPHTPATYHLISGRRLRLMKPHAILVNTSRGQVVEEEALARALYAREIAGAGLDVYEREPEIHPRLLELDNVVLLPHIGSATHDGRFAMGERVIVNIKTFVDGHTPPNKVVTTMF